MILKLFQFRSSKAFLAFELFSIYRILLKIYSIALHRVTVSCFARRSAKLFSSMSSFTSSSASNWTPSGSPGSLQHLCSVSQRACELLTPMVQSFYSALNSSTSMLKEDKSVFTIADGTVQHLLVEHLFGPIENTTRFRNIIGEEECTVNLTNKPYTVAGLQIPDLFNEQVEQTRDSIRTLSSLLPAGHELYSTLSVFIDPIDGTREFATGLGEQCSICIGFSDVSGFPVAGVVYRPITTPPTWAAGAKSENYRAGVLQSSADQVTATGLLTSNGGISPFLVALMDEVSICDTLLVCILIK